MTRYLGRPELAPAGDALDPRGPDPDTVRAISHLERLLESHDTSRAAPAVEEPPLADESVLLSKTFRWQIREVSDRIVICAPSPETGSHTLAKLLDEIAERSVAVVILDTSGAVRMDPWWDHLVRKALSDLRELGVEVILFGEVDHTWATLASHTCQRMFDAFDVAISVRPSPNPDDALPKAPAPEPTASPVSLTDPLTGLATQALLMDRLQHRIRRGRRAREGHFGLLLVAIDGFEEIANRSGKPFAESLLRHIAMRIRPAIRDIDTFAKLYGDGFAVLLDQIDRVQTAVQVVERIRQRLMQPFDLGGHEIAVTTSAGIVFARDEYGDPSALLADAEKAVHRAKRDSKAMYVFDSGMHRQAPRTSELGQA